MKIRSYEMKRIWNVLLIFGLLGGNANVQALYDCSLEGVDQDGTNSTSLDCTACISTAGYADDGTGNACACDVSLGYASVSGGGSCECDPAGNFDTTFSPPTRCACDAPYQDINSSGAPDCRILKTCTDPGVDNAAAPNCVDCLTADGFVDINGICECDSSLGFALDTSTNTCICDPGGNFDPSFVFDGSTRCPCSEADGYSDQNSTGTPDCQVDCTLDVFDGSTNDTSGACICDVNQGYTGSDPKACQCNSALNMVDTDTSVTFDRCSCNTANNFIDIEADLTVTPDCRCNTYDTSASATTNLFLINSAGDECFHCYSDVDADGSPDLIGDTRASYGTTCDCPSGYHLSDNNECFRCSTDLSTESGWRGITAIAIDTNCGLDDAGSGTTCAVDINADQPNTGPCLPDGVLNAACDDGRCKCDTDYYANEARDFCVHCPAPGKWDPNNFHCGDKEYWYGDDTRGWCNRCEVQREHAQENITAFHFIDNSQQPTCTCVCNTVNKYWYNAEQHNCYPTSDFFCPKCADSTTLGQLPNEPEGVSFDCWNMNSVPSTQWNIDSDKYFCNPNQGGVCRTRTYAYELKDRNSEVIGIIRDCGDDLVTIDDVFSEFINDQYHFFADSETLQTRKTEGQSIYIREICTPPMESTALARSEAVPVTSNSTLDMYPNDIVHPVINIIKCYECSAMTEDNNDKCIKPSSSTPYTYCEKNSCQAVIRSYKLDGKKFYFAQRGCTQRPEDGVPPNTATVNPVDFDEKDNFPKQMVTNVDTIVQRSIVDLGNNYQSYKLDVATPFECISCKGEASVTLQSRINFQFGVNLDNANLGLCWNIETGQNYNGVSCDSQCYTKATMLSHGNKTHVTYTMSAERGCRESSVSYLAEQKEISKFHNVKSDVYACDFSDGQKCNDENLDDKLLDFEEMTLLKCKICDTKLFNTNKNHPCIQNATTLPDTICPDATYRSCGVNTTAAYSGADARFETSRFCSRNLPLTRMKETPHPDYTGATLTSYHCNTNGCNIFAGDVVPDGTPALTTTTITTTTSSAKYNSFTYTAVFYLFVQFIF